MNNQLEQTLLASAAVSALNSAFQADPQAVWTLMNTYTVCNEALAEHPTVQVIEKEVEGAPKYTVSLLGILNGVLEPIIGRKVCIMTSEPNEEGKRKLIGFDVYKDTEEEKSKLVLP